MKPLSLIPPRRVTARERVLAGLVVAGAAGVALLLFLSEPGKTVIPFPPCLFHSLTGLHCPGCGTGRALVNLFHGRLYAAWRMNPLAVLLLPVPFFFVLNQAVAAVSGRTLPGIFLPPRAVWALFAAVLSFWILRNIPLYPFTLLEPALLP